MTSATARQLPRLTAKHDRARAVRWLFPLLGVALTLVWGTLSLLRLRAMYGLGFDLGFYLQQVWLISRGISDGTLANLPMFADHFSPILAAFTPLADSPYLADVMLSVQACAFGISVWLLGDTLQGFAPDRTWWILAYIVLSPVVGFTLLFDFHPTVLGLPLLVLALRSSRNAYSTGSLLWLMASSILIREDIALLVALIVLIGQRRREGQRIVKAVGLMVAIGAALYVLVGTAFLSVVATHPIHERYAWVGMVLTDPLSVDLSGMFSGYVPVTLLVVFFPLVLFPSALSSGTTLLAFLGSAVHLVADFVPADSIYYQYHILPVYLVAWSLATQTTPWDPPRIKGKATSVAVVSVVLAVTLGPLAALEPPAEVKDRWGPFILGEQHRRVMAGLREKVPAGASVSASTTLVRLFAQREEIYGFPDPLTCRARFTPGRGATSYPDYVALDLDRGEQEDDLLNRLAYRPVAAAGGAVLFRAPLEPPDVDVCPSDLALSVDG